MMTELRSGWLAKVRPSTHRSATKIFQRVQDLEEKYAVSLRSCCNTRSWMAVSYCTVASGRYWVERLPHTSSHPRHAYFRRAESPPYRLCSTASGRHGSWHVSLRRREGRVRRIRLRFRQSRSSDSNQSRGRSQQSALHATESAYYRNKNTFKWCACFRLHKTLVYSWQHTRVQSRTSPQRPFKGGIRTFLECKQGFKKYIKIRWFLKLWNHGREYYIP